MKFYKQLIDAICIEDFYKTNEILLAISKEDDSIDYVDKLLLFMEDNPDIDYVLFDRNEEGKLVESEKRSKRLTLWKRDLRKSKFRI